MGVVAHHQRLQPLFRGLTPPRLSLFLLSPLAESLIQELTQRNSSSGILSLPLRLPTCSLGEDGAVNGRQYGEYFNHVETTVLLGISFGSRVTPIEPPF